MSDLSGSAWWHYPWHYPRKRHSSGGPSASRRSNGTCTWYTYWRPIFDGFPAWFLRWLNDWLLPRTPLDELVWVHLRMVTVSLRREVTAEYSCVHPAWTQRSWHGGAVRPWWWCSCWNPSSLPYPWGQIGRPPVVGLRCWLAWLNPGRQPVISTICRNSHLQ